MPAEIQKGLPGEFLLLFTVLIWVLFILIRLGNSQNMLNRWCFLSGMVFSIGVFKEYLYFTFFPWLISACPSHFDQSKALAVYSVLTGIFYYFSMPSALVFGLYYCHFNERHPRLFPWTRLAVFLPAFVFGLLFPYTNTRYYQLNSRPYFLSITFYNWIYGILLTFMIVRTLHKERHEECYHQKKMVSILVLVPIWYWLTSALLVHSLGLTRYFKAWQGNFLIIVFLLIYFLRYAFRGGIMGTRFKHETFDWDKKGQLINQNARCTQHLLKNEISKIEWCAKNLALSSGREETGEYARIIIHSTDHLKNCLEKIQYYSQDIRLNLELCSVSAIMEECVTPYKRRFPNIQMDIQCDEEQFLSCDKEYVKEVLNNLILNAADAMDGNGILIIRASVYPRQERLVISVSDTGTGIRPEALSKLFEPYSSTKTSDGHMGLGLYFCQKVMEKHRGKITADSLPDKGTVFSLHFPWKKALQNRNGNG